MLLDDPGADATPLLWSQVTEVSEVWTDVYNVSAEESRPALTAYRLRWADGQTREISRSFQNVRDPYREVGQLLKGLMPAAAGHALPAFPTIDEIIAAYAGTRVRTPDRRGRGGPWALPPGSPVGGRVAEGQPGTTLTSPIPRAPTGALIWDASPTRIVTRRFSGNPAMTAAVASAVLVSVRRTYSCAW